MKKIIKDLIEVSLFILVGFLFLVLLLKMNEDSYRRNIEREQAQAQVNNAEVSSFDTSALEESCGSAIGTVRLVPAEYIGDNDIDEQVLEDIYGNQWRVSDLPLMKEDYIVLWIDDMDTTANIADDEIVKVTIEPFMG